ncbi:hypothetical protein QWY75_03745 [Pontixanthobacter aestiaquae]|uniref:Uncharacterized protein n=1 Tax=Pontixanthobacter aestiaquae TaxID=1509367 RepID=A0A844ZD00_9SPHN|nr:hypothetical protein [Pontixanthobacter aestiaquae]MDN3645320.1 hypothetical protein [Pontixanthobacter aestiaquae]MXO83679.1 hypothetical protein [Pontixanthobacter aestiaquae]
MSIFLATAATAAMAGTTFDCRADTAYLTIFAPSEEVTAAHRGNVLTLYKVTGDGEVLAADRKIAQVFDGLPTSLYIKLTATDFDVELDISDVDLEAGTSAIAIKGTMPDGETMEVKGTCTVATASESEAS